MKERDRREQWLEELASFIVEANRNTWAAEGAEVSPERPGYKELEYKSGLWRLRDSYTGYFRAPGMTTIYYKDIPSWNMQYGGHGMTDGNRTFTQTGLAGIIIQRDSDKKPQLPWNL